MKQNLAKMLGQGRNAFIVHGNADPDALASAYALCQAFSGRIIAPGGIDRMSKVIAESLGIEFEETLEKDDFDQLVVLDTSGPEQLGDLRYLGDDENVIVIDHHSRNQNWKSRQYYCDDKKSSCCEIAYELVKVAEKRIPRNAALALLVGILTDSGHFRYGNRETLLTFSEIMSQHDIGMREPIELIEGEMDLSEKISQLKGAQRLKYTRVEQFIIATSFGSAYEASVSKSLIQMGADIAFVGSQRGDEFRISARASPQMIEMGIHLGKLLEGIGKETSNGGGGHPAAAGLSGKGDVKQMLDLCVAKSKKAIKSLLPPRH
ncbi:MAG: DHH family phosphoesterase [Thermoplasmata archaeon]